MDSRPKPRGGNGTIVVAEFARHQRFPDNPPAGRSTPTGEKLFGGKSLQCLPKRIELAKCGECAGANFI
jgi:hypothetical protein